MRRSPQEGFSAANRKTNRRSSGGVQRPPLRWPRGWVQRCFTKSRCHRKIVAGVTIRCSRQAWDSNLVSAANIARSAQDSRGLLTWRCNTATSWRSTRIFAFFDCELRVSSPSQAMSCRKIRYSSRTATTDDHARRPLSSGAAGHPRGWPVRHPQASTKTCRRAWTSILMSREGWRR